MALYIILFRKAKEKRTKSSRWRENRGVFHSAGFASVPASTNNRNKTQKVQTNANWFRRSKRTKFKRQIRLINHIMHICIELILNCVLNISHCCVSNTKAGSWWSSGRRSVRIAQHELERIGERVGVHARVVTGGHERGHAQDEQHDRLDGQRRADDPAEEAVAALQHASVHLGRCGSSRGGSNSSSSSIVPTGPSLGRSNES